MIGAKLEPMKSVLTNAYNPETLDTLQKNDSSCSANLIGCQIGYKGPTFPQKDLYIDFYSFTVSFDLIALCSDLVLGSSQREFTKLSFL